MSGISFLGKELKSVVINDNKDLDEVLNKISMALRQVDVHSTRNIIEKVQHEISICDFFNAGHDKGGILQQMLYTTLCSILGNWEKPCETPGKVILFTGLEGSGITTTAAKYALYYKALGLKSAIVCADESGFWQSKGLADAAQIPFYGSETESNSVKVAREGVAHFTNSGSYDLIIVDTRGRNRNNKPKCDEIQSIYNAINPDLVLYVISASISGVLSVDIVSFFKEKIGVDGMIVSKANGSMGGGGAFSAAVASKLQVIFTGTGPYLQDFEVFDSKKFVTVMTGITELSQFEELVPKPSEKYTMRHMYNLFKHTMKMSSDKDCPETLLDLPNFVKGFISLYLGSDSHKDKLMVFVKMIDAAITGPDMDDWKSKTTHECRKLAKKMNFQPELVEEMFEIFETLLEDWKLYSVEEKEVK